MWEEVNFNFRTENSTRRLIIRSNYLRMEGQPGIIDPVDYSVYENLSPFESMKADEMLQHYQSNVHWNADPYLDKHCVFLGMLHVNLDRPEFHWPGKPDDLTLTQQAALVEYLITTDVDPDLDFDFDRTEDGTYVSEEGITEVRNFAFGGLSGCNRTAVSISWKIKKRMLYC